MLNNNADLHLTGSKKTVLFSAGSLSQAFKKIANEVLMDQGIYMEADFGSTARMAKLIREGTSCDVFVAADMTTPQKFVDSGRSGYVIPLVRNDTVAVARRDLGIRSDTLCDFLVTSRPSSIGISDPETQPCGANALQGLSRVLSESGLNRSIRIVTGGLDKKREKTPGEKSDYTLALENDTELLLVFRTTAQKICAQMESAQIIELPPSMAITAQYGMAALSDNPAGLRLMEYLQTPKVKNIFEGFGFDAVR